MRRCFTMFSAAGSADIRGGAHLPASPETDRAEAFATLNNLGLGTYVHRRAFEVSGGEQQRAALARALFQEPEMFLADEPISNLDSDLTCRVLQILRAQTRQESRTVVCVLHDRELVEQFADLVITLNPDQPQEWTLRVARHQDENAAARQ